MLDKLKSALPFWTPNIDGIWNEISGAKYQHLDYDKQIPELENDISILKNLKCELSELSDDEMKKLLESLSEHQSATYIIILDKDKKMALSNLETNLQMTKNKRYYLEYASEFLDLTGNLSLDIQTINYLNTIRARLQNEQITEDEAFLILPKNYVA
jgi:hypothetical protein